MKIIIVGGVAGGASAAARIRRLDEKAQITLFERTGHISYANCGLPYYVGGVIEDAEALTLQTPESFFARFRIDAKTRHEVTAIDRQRRTVTVKDLSTGQSFEERYDKLLLSPGAKPVIPSLPGINSPRVFTLRTVEDALALRQHIEKRPPRSAVVIGGGFIGLETAENLTRVGAQVTVIQRGSQLLAPLDEDMAPFLHAKMQQMGITLRLDAQVTGFEALTEGVRISLANAPSLEADLVVLAVGVTPDSALAKAAGLTLGLKDSILVNARMQTSDPNIYAVGDAVQVRHGVSGKEVLIALAGPANKQGRIAADNICGGSSFYKASYGSSVIKVFDMTIAFTGLNEKAAKAAKLAYQKLFLSPDSHAGYYPCGRAMTIKLLYEKGTLRILGAQIVGFDGVDKRLDVIATAMQAGMNVLGLKDLDLAYAPPFSSAKDPVNMAGFIAENVERGKVKQFYFEHLNCLPANATRLDTRTPQEYARGHAPGFVNIPLDDLRDRLDALPARSPVYVMCQSGLRSYLACRILSQNGFDCYNFAGGYRFYEADTLHRFAENVNTSCGLTSL
ncbi:MAG: FAD-dependent oxidoreductase [Clostridia bacterium]|nr:FAD-dependent oxidoreductase [Clostridia bacterium]